MVQTPLFLKKKKFKNREKKSEKEEKIKILCLV
jgi:hypothetical protein